MNPVDPTIRVIGIHFDYPSWHAHLAARGPAARLVVVPRPSSRESRPARTGRLLHLSLATWEARLAGATRRAA